MERKRNKLVLSLALASSLGLAACTANDISSGVGIAGNLFKGFTVSNDQLASEATLSAKALDSENKVASSKNKYTRRLNKLTKNLKHYDGLDLNFKVYLSDNVNAFAMPDGTVRVYSGLMDIMNDDELVAVIGHEIGHVKNQHTLSQYRKAYVAKAAASGLTAYGGDTVSALAGSYGDIGLSALNAQFSQSDELESDAYGVKVLAALGRDPYAAVSAQEKLQAQGGGKGGFFASHPSSAKRIKKAKEAADEIAKK